MLATTQEMTVISRGNASQGAYTVEDVFERIDQKLTEAFGENFEARLNGDCL